MKKILSFVLCICMVVGVLSGCASLNSTSAKNNASSNKVVNTEKLEEKYVERMNAYLEYYQDEEDSSEYTVAGAVSLDSDNLPILWLSYAEDEEDEDDIAGYIQVIGYENGKVTILAETGYVKDVEDIYPIVSTQGIALYYDGLENFLMIYDEEKEEFINWEVDRDYVTRVGVETFIKNLEEKPDIYNWAYTQYGYMITDSNQIVYLGKSCDYDVIGWMIVEAFFAELENSIRERHGLSDDSELSDDIQKEALTELKNSRFMQEFCEQHGVKNDEGKEWWEFINEVVDEQGNRTTRVFDYDWSFPNIETLESDDLYEYVEYYIDKENIDVDSEDFDVDFDRGEVEWKSGMEMETRLRYLAKHPIYTADEIVLDNIADCQRYYDDIDYEVVDFDVILKDVENYKKTKLDVSE